MALEVCTQYKSNCSLRPPTYLSRTKYLHEDMRSHDGPPHGVIARGIVYGCGQGALGIGVGIKECLYADHTALDFCIVRTQNTNVLSICLLG